MQKITRSSAVRSYGTVAVMPCLNWNSMRGGLPSLGRASIHGGPSIWGGAFHPKGVPTFKTFYPKGLLLSMEEGTSIHWGWVVLPEALHRKFKLIFQHCSSVCVGSHGERGLSPKGVCHSVVWVVIQEKISPTGEALKRMQAHKHTKAQLPCSIALCSTPRSIAQPNYKRWEPVRQFEWGPWRCVLVTLKPVPEQFVQPPPAGQASRAALFGRTMGPVKGKDKFCRILIEPFTVIIYIDNLDWISGQETELLSRG